MTSDNSLTNTLILPPEAFGAAGDTLDGADLLLFDGKIGLWNCGKARAEIPIGTRAVIGIDAMQKGFVRFDGGMPQSHLLPLWPVPDLRALRQSLGDLDRDLWPERDARGAPQDPWRPYRKLPLTLLETGEQLIYATSSQGGITTISQLGQQVRTERRYRDATALPIVSLEADSYPHKNKMFGMIHLPVLKLGGWTSHNVVEEVTRDGNLDKLLPAPAAPPREETERGSERRPRTVAAPRQR
jgi:hypothetical protein